MGMGALAEDEFAEEYRQNVLSRQWRGSRLSAIAWFSTLTTNPDLKAILAQVEGATGAYAFEIAPHLWLIGCLSQEHDPASFDHECRQALSDAERVREMLRDVDLDW